MKNIFSNYFSKFLLLAIFSPSVFLLTGCATITGFPNSPASSTATYPNPGYQLGEAGILKYNAETDPIAKKNIRNDIIDARVAEIDKNFFDFEHALYLEGVGSGIGTDWTVLALTAASTLSRVTNTKTIFSATSTAVVGGDASFDKRALFDKTLPSLLAQMLAERETVRTKIRKQETMSVTDYTLFAALSDIDALSFAGSIPGAITAVTKDAGQKQEAARQAQNDIVRTSYYKSATTVAISTYFSPNGKTVNPDHLAEVNKWLGQHGYDNGVGGVESFLINSDNAAAHARLAKDLGISPQ